MSYKMDFFIKELETALVHCSWETYQYKARIPETEIMHEHFGSSSIIKFNGFEDHEDFYNYLNIFHTQALEELVIKVNSMPSKEDKLLLLFAIHSRLGNAKNLYFTINKENSAFIKHSNFEFINTSLQEENKSLMCSEKEIQEFYKTSYHYIEHCEKSLILLIDLVKTFERSDSIYLPMREENKKPLKDKIKLNLSVEQLSVFLNVLMNTEIIKSESKAGLYRWVNTLFETLESNNISIQNLQGTSTKYTDNTLVFWEEEFKKFINITEKFLTDIESQRK